MTKRWGGPFSGMTPAVAGWCNTMSADATAFPRYGDGDFVASGIWQEAYGNANYQVARSRRLLWMDVFQAANYEVGNDPVYFNPGSSGVNIWDAASIYAVTPPILLTPSITNGIRQSPTLKCRIRAKRSVDTGTHKVRIYGCASVDAVREGNWTGLDAHCEFDVTSDSYHSSLSDDAGFQPNFSWETFEIPVSGAQPEEVTVMTTVLVLAGVRSTGSTNGNGPIIQAVHVWEDVVAS